MDIQKEMAQYENILSSLGYGHRSLSKSDLGYLNPITQFGFEIWYASQKAAKAEAVPAWIDYTKQSPRIDGRYQIFISGEQITADWQSPFGFSDPVEGDALIQELISHWAMLPEPPKTQDQGHESK